MFLVVEDIFCSFIIINIIIYIRCSLLTQTFRMNLRVLDRRFNYVVAPEIYYTRLDFMSCFV